MKMNLVTSNDFLDFLDNETKENLISIIDLIDEKNHYSHISLITKIIHIFHFLFYKNHLKSYKNSSLKKCIEVSVSLHNKEKKKLKKYVRKNLRQVNVSFYDQFDYDDSLKGIKPIEERGNEEKIIFKNFNSYNSYVHLGGCLEPLYFKKFNWYSGKKIIVDINQKQMNYTKKRIDNLFTIDFDLSLLYGNYNEKSIFNDILNLYLNYHNLKLNDLFEFLSNDIIFMLKTFDLLDDHIKYAVTEELLTNLKYKQFILSFPKKTLSGKRMHVNRKEIWLEKMCERLNINYDIKDTNNELFYFLNTN